MAPTLKDLGIDKLNVADRIELVQAIWDSIAAESAQMELSEQQWDFIERRLAEQEANPREGSTWEVVKARSATRN